MNVILLQFYLHPKAIVTLLYITIKQGKMSIDCIVILVILLFEINKMILREQKITTLQIKISLKEPLNDWYCLVQL